MSAVPPPDMSNVPPSFGGAMMTLVLGVALVVFYLFSWLSSDLR